MVGLFFWKVAHELSAFARIRPDYSQSSKVMLPIDQVGKQANVNDLGVLNSRFNSR